MHILIHMLAIAIPAILIALSIRQNALFLWYTAARRSSWYHFILGAAYLVTSVIAWEVCIIRPDHGVYAALDLIVGIATFTYGNERMALARSARYISPL